MLWEDSKNYFGRVFNLKIALVQLINMNERFFVGKGGMGGGYTKTLAPVFKSSGSIFDKPLMLLLSTYDLRLKQNLRRYNKGNAIIT